MVDPSLLVAVAASIAAGEPEVDAIVARLTTTVGQPRLWMRPLAERYLKFFHGGTRPRLYEVVAFLEKQRSLRKLSVKRWLTEPQRMQPVEAAKHWDLPAIETVGDLARWLQLEPTELDWFADLKGINRGKLDHYHYRVLSKGSGGLRVIEAPKPRLKRIQIQILERILSRIQPHPAAHGFVKGRSIQSFSLPHVGQHVVLKMDLQDYFPSFPRQPDSGLLSDRGLSGIRGRSARGPLHQRWPIEAPAPAAGGANLPSTGEPRHLPHRLPARRACEIRRSAVHPATPTTSSFRATPRSSAAWKDSRSTRRRS